MWKKVELTGLTPVASLEGAALDWAVAKAEGVDGYIVNESFMTRWTDDECEDGVDYHYSTDWAQGGPIIERDIAKIERFSDALWEATAYTKDAQDIVQSGPTPLIAAMRCYVASKLGDEVKLERNTNEN
jgi:hypothetical protein